MPANQHPDEVKVVHSVDRIGICIWTSIVTRRVALSMTGQLPLKRPFEGPADEHGGFSSYGNACVVLTAQCHFLLQCGRGVGRSCNFECNALMICSCLWIVLPLLVLCTVCPVYMPSPSSTLSIVPKHCCRSCPSLCMSWCQLAGVW